MNREARYYTVVDKERVRCSLCPHNCTIKDGKSGQCGVRVNENGKLISTIYGELTSLAIDPIEKKPLYHFYPGSDILSIGTRGCNFKCPFCQNWHISQDMSVKTTFYSAEDIVESASRKNSIGIAYTYSEPMIWFEYVYDCSKIARERGLKNVYVTNGFINQEPLLELLKYADAMNIDLKSFQEDTYKRVQKGKLSDVLQTIQTAHERCHVEITTLIVTGINDTIDEMKSIIDWISSLDKNLPWHISRYHPSYKYNAPATDVDFMLEVYDEAIKKLNYVFCGNISGSYGRSDTSCPSCKSVVISRSGYFTSINNLANGTCGSCGYDLKIIQ
jgi:pyruvate formate lyase activating enzyme